MINKWLIWFNKWKWITIKAFKKQFNYGFWGNFSYVLIILTYGFFTAKNATPLNLVSCFNNESWAEIFAFVGTAFLHSCSFFLFFLLYSIFEIVWDEKTYNKTSQQDFDKSSPTPQTDNIIKFFLKILIFLIFILYTIDAI